MDKKPLVAMIATGAVLFSAGYWSANGGNRLIESAAAQSGSVLAMAGDRHRDFCADLSGRRLDLMTKLFAVDLDLTAEQIERLDAVTGSILETATRPDGICALPALSVDGSDLPAAIASSRAWLAAAQYTLDDLEPSLNAFYGSLDDVQKSRLSDWLSEGHHWHEG